MFPGPPLYSAVQGPHFPIFAYVIKLLKMFTGNIFRGYTFEIIYCINIRALPQALCTSKDLFCSCISIRALLQVNPSLLFHNLLHYNHALHAVIAVGDRSSWYLLSRQIQCIIGNFMYLYQLTITYFKSRKTAYLVG